jgi:signal transduction histidine kinase
MLQSLRTKVLLLTATFGLVLAAGLAALMYTSVFQYYSDWQYQRTQQFLERIALAHPDLWKEYNNAGSGFGQTLRQYILYSPNTGLYLVDKEGKVLSSAGEGRIFWSSYKISLEPLLSTHQVDPSKPKFGDDPDVQGASCIVALYPVLAGEEVKGYLYAVARDAVLQVQTTKLLGSYAIRTSIKAGLLTILVGLLLTAAVLASFTRPLSRLTKALEDIKAKGFSGDDLADGNSTNGNSTDRNSTGQSLGIQDLDRNDEIGRLSRTFVGLFERLKEEMRTVKRVDLQRRDMIASVSHDLRTPLTALSGQLETIRIKGAALSLEEQARYVDLAFNNAQHLKRLTDSLADLARLDNPSFEAKREPMALGELADDLVQRYRLRAEQQGVTLNVDYPDGLPLIPLDASLMERALSNLLDNALRVTPAQGRITVTVRGEPERGAQTITLGRPTQFLPKGAAQRLSVSDTGPGVAPEEQSKIFQKFYQASQHREHRGSAGLGLAIVQRVADLHEGRVTLDSVLGKGSTFSVIFPAQ